MNRAKCSKETVARLAGITRRHFAYILAGERNAAPRTAEALDRATGIPRDVWTFGTAAQRQQAWEQHLLEARP